MLAFFCLQVAPNHPEASNNPSKHAQQLGAGGSAGSDVEVPQVEVLRARVQSRVCRSSSAWANCWPPSSVTRSTSASATRTKVPLATLPPAPTRARAKLASLVVGAPGLMLDHHGVLRERQAPVLPLVDLNSVKMRSSERRFSVNSWQ